MWDMYIANVGDGLCVAVHTAPRQVIQIDCGTRQKSKVALEGWKRIVNNFHLPDVFVLSHLHTDHYNGLLHASVNRERFPRLKIKKVFYPRIPKFTGRERLANCLWAMNSRVFGNETGLMEYDFLKAISRITTTSFGYAPLSSGDTFGHSGSVFRVLWPPARIDDQKTLAVIGRALRDFEKAMQEDEQTRMLYDLVEKEGVFRRYLDGEYQVRDSHEHVEEYMNPRYQPKSLPTVVLRANRSLREAANHLSLAFFEDNRLLFLGDTEAWEIRQIVKDLQSQGRENFHVFITPHHGTHWDGSLRRIRCTLSATSNGRRSWWRWRPYFLGISKRSMATIIHGDIKYAYDSRRRL